MITTLNAATLLPAPFILDEHIPAVTVDYTGTAYCPDCGTDLGDMATLAGGWVDLTAVDTEAYEIHGAHLDSDEVTRDCLNW